MKVYVVMGNDYPAAVYRSEAESEAYCARRRDQDKAVIPKHHPGIYWRSHEFELLGGDHQAARNTESLAEEGKNGNLVGG